MRISDWSSDVCSSDLAAPTTPTLPQPLGTKGSKLAPFIIGIVRAMNSVSAVTFTATRTALNRALSFVPIISSQVTSSAMMSAGRFTTPPAYGPEASAGGTTMPSEMTSSPTKEHDQPTDTELSATEQTRMQTRARRGGKED